MKQIFKVGEKIGPYKVTFISEEPQRKYKRYLKCECAECGKPFVGRIDSIKSGKLFRCEECKKRQHSKQWKEALKKANSKEAKDKRKIYNPGDIIHNIILFKKEIEPYYESKGHKRRKGKFINLETGIEYEALLKSVIDKTSLGLGGKSKGEIIIRKILNKMKINFVTEYIFKNCINPKTGHNLLFDFYLPDYNCCIEFDGEQHFKEIKYFSDTLEERQFRDNIKNKYCENNNIKLIRIPYFEIENISNILQEKLDVEGIDEI